MAEIYRIDAPPGFSPRLAEYVARMDDVRTRTKRLIKDLTTDQLSWHPNPIVESIGTLLLHIAAVEYSWIQEDVMGHPMGEEWMIAFPIRFGLEQVSGQPLEHFVKKLDQVRDESKAVLSTLADDELSRCVTSLDERDKPGARQYTIEWILHHLIDHESHHKGQIAMMKRLIPA